MTDIQAISVDDIIDVPVAEIALVPVPPAEPELPVAERVMTELASFQERMILARQLTLGTDNVRSRALCATGVHTFMARGHLVPTHGQDGRQHPVRETAEDAAVAEQKIRDWVSEKLGGDITDFTSAGLRKRLVVLRAAHEQWKREFLQLIRDNHQNGSITRQRMNEVLPQLGLLNPQTRMRVALHADFDFIIDKPGNGTVEAIDAYRAALRDRLLAALRRLPGDGHTYEGTRYHDRATHVQVHAYEITGDPVAS